MDWVLIKSNPLYHSLTLKHYYPFSVSILFLLYLDKTINNNLDDKFLYDYWKKIVNACFDQGFVLGFDFELPKII